MMQVYVKGSVQAAKLYEEAFGATLLCEYKNAEGVYEHAELDIFGQIFAISELMEEKSITGNTMQFCLHLGEGGEEHVIRAFEVLKQDATIIIPLGPCPFSSCMTCIIDKFGVNWCIFV